MFEHIKKQLRNSNENILGSEKMKKYAVLLPLIVHSDNSVSILLQVRAKSLRRQPGEISFPGGKIENSDPSPKDAAIRETSEELGIAEKEIEVIHDLGVFFHNRRSIIYPYVARIHTEDFKPSPHEVDELFLVPIEFFLQNQPEKYIINMKIEPEKEFPYHLIPGGREYPWRFSKIDELFYQYNDHIIWGMTANIVNHFISIIKKA